MAKSTKNKSDGEKTISSEGKSDTNRKTMSSDMDSQEEQRGKGGSGKKSSKDALKQDSNQQGFGEDE